ncbi:MAG: methylated-DNA--[protein]-cysteine S-methyltransferase [Chromatiales bacterium]|nr:methylated-DNA--[protein]-cysteine S-methyltransferase [Chromatiales bacterium]
MSVTPRATPYATNACRSRDWEAVLLAACRVLEAAPGPRTLAAVARQLGVGAAELQRQFRARLGASPREYQRALRLRRAGQLLGQPGGTLAALLAAGFGSSAAGHEDVRAAFGVSPGRLARVPVLGGWLGLSALGWMLMAATPRGICWLAFGDDPAALVADCAKAFPGAQLVDDEPRLWAWFDAVREHLLLPRGALELPLDVQGTAFQARVWQALRRIPVGATVGYGELARQLGEPRAVRAVAAACARNPVAVVVPCHRVVGSNGQLTGYRWGLDRKRRLLAAEGAV